MSSNGNDSLPQAQPAGQPQTSAEKIASAFTGLQPVVEPGNHGINTIERAKQAVLDIFETELKELKDKVNEQKQIIVGLLSAKRKSEIDMMHGYYGEAKRIRNAMDNLYDRRKQRQN